MLEQPDSRQELFATRMRERFLFGSRTADDVALTRLIS